MSELRWRTGRKVGRTVYCDDKLVGLMDTAELADFFVSLANRFEQVRDEVHAATGEPTSVRFSAAPSCQGPGR